MNELRQREPSIEVQWLRDLARGKPCMFRVDGVCNGNTETTTWAHSNQSKHGKGIGKKSHDPHGAFACSACHDWYDNKRPHVDAELKDRTFDIARDRTWEYIFRHRLVRKS